MTIPIGDCDHPDGWSSNLLAIGVFVGTTLLSQWLIHREEQRRSPTTTNNKGRWRFPLLSTRNITNTTSSRSDNHLGCCDTASWRPELDDNDAEEEYQNRRVAGRMSFHEESEHPIVIAMSGHPPPRMGRISPSLSVATNVSSVDGVFPKNSNWKHFEHVHSTTANFHHRVRSLTDDLRSLSSEVAIHNDLDGEDVSDSSSEELASMSLTNNNDKFSWTEPLNASSSHRRRHKKYKNIRNGLPHLPIILSQRAMERTESIESRLTSDGSISRPTTPQQPACAESSSSFSPLQDYNRAGEGRFRNTIESPTMKTDRTSFQPVSSSNDASMKKAKHHTNGLHDQRYITSTPILNGDTIPPPIPLSGTPQIRRTESEQIKHHNRHARALYNARIIPNKLILIRHAESMGNTNEELYSTTPDNAMPLTKFGWEQARACGRHLRDEIIRCQPGERVHFIVSPYVRTVETFHGIASAWCDPATLSHIPDRDQRIKAWYDQLVDAGITWQEDPRIREQDFGNFQRPEQIKQYKKDRHKFGAFYYRFPHGESASDVFDRISTFLDSLWRSFDMSNSRYFVLVTHGIAIRVLLARYFRYSIDQFSMLANPRNCEMILLEHNNRGRLEFAGRCEPCGDEDCNAEQATILGFKYHKKLRVLPEEYVSHPKIRISFND